MNKFNRKALVIFLSVSVGLGGCATTGANGQKQTDLGGTAGIGALAGAVIGNLIGGDTKSTVLGAAIGGGIGYMVGLDAQRKELEAAKVAAAELQKETAYLKPVVYSQGYQDVKSGERAEGLKSIDIPLPIGQMTDKKTGALTDKGIEAVVKLQAVADKTGSMEIIVPASLKASTFAAIAQNAPRAKISIGDDEKVLARITGKPLDANGGVRVAA